jgi:hypothetical protein
MLHPDYPVIEGEYQLTNEWSITLPGQFNRRIEEGDLVIWRPGLTIWLVVWDNDDNETKEERLNWLQSEMSPGAFDIQKETDQLLRLGYRLKEDSDDERVAGFYGYVIGECGYVQMAVYFGDEGDITVAEALWRSLEEQPR